MKQKIYLISALLSFLIFISIGSFAKQNSVRSALKQEVYQVRIGETSSCNTSSGKYVSKYI